MSKKTLLSGMKPTSIPTLGNYIGALNNWSTYQEEYECFFPIVDLHGITEAIDPKLLNYNSKIMAAFYIAGGIDPDKSYLFMQSHIPEHTELTWFLMCHTGMGELSRMTQYKDKVQKHEKNIMAGLFTYPVLMAADILLYHTSLVPVGADQKQHVELTRDIAERVNSRYGEIFTLPEPFIAKVGARIMDLQNPLSKMSKSDETGKGVIYLTDSDKMIAKKIKSAVTDSGTEITFDPENKPGIANILTIHSVLSGKDIPHLVKEYEGKMYGHLKVDTADLTVSKIGPVREAILRIIKDEAYLNGVLKKGEKKAREIARDSLNKIYQKTGFIPRIP